LTLWENEIDAVAIMVAMRILEY